MLTLQLRSKSTEDFKPRLGKYPTAKDAAIRLTDGDAKVFKPNGDVLLVVVRGALKPETREAALAFGALARNQFTSNRGFAGGGGRLERAVKRDGTVSNTTHAAAVRSMVVGSMDRYARFPYCRQTAFTEKFPAEWETMRPLAHEVAAVFAKHMPARYKAQLEAAHSTRAEYVIPGTPFSTITLNNTYNTGLHTDAGDYAPGFGCMAMARRGEWEGCELVVPAYRVALDLQHGDVVLFDVHEVHGNLPFRRAVGEPITDYERMSFVCYLREKITECLSPAEEVERARQQRGGFVQEEED